MVGMCGIFAEFERSIIQQRVKAGLERARANGVRLGRPAISQGMKDEILAMRATGMSMNKIAGEIGISKSVVVRTVNR